MLPIQRKLAVGEANDPLEAEADRMAERVLRGDEATTVRFEAPKLRRKCACEDSGIPCEECAKKKKLQRKAAGSVAQSEAPPMVHHVLRSPGQALEPSVRSFFESRFGRDFGSVRVHADAPSAESARSVDALAYTVGNHLVFSRGSYDPSAPEGRKLLAHELAHVVQQGKSDEIDDAPLVRRQTRPQSGNRTQTNGRVLFVQVDRSRSTISFVTESGTKVYELLSPTDLAAGSYRFSVHVTGNNLQLSIQGGTTQNSPFQYRIQAGQPNPASLLRGEHQVDVQVIEGSSGASSSAPTDQADPAASDARSQVSFHAQQMTPAQFQAMTGVSADALPDRALVSGNSLQPSSIAASMQGRNRRGDSDSPFPTSDRGIGGLAPGIGGGAILTRFPSYPIPPNSTGILWTQVGAGHLSEFSNVGGNMTARGFRYDMWYNLFPEMRSTGVPGSFQNDLLFTMMPNQTIVYRSSTPSAAEAFARQLLAAQHNETYRFPPRTGGPTAVCGRNCINVPVDEVTAALGVRPEIQTPDGPVDVLRQGRLREGAPFEPSQAGRGATMREYLGQNDSSFAERGLTRASVGNFTPAARGAVGFIKVGGVIFMIYGAYRTAERISQTPEAERPRVEMEEAGSWVGGALGSALGAAAAGAIFCLPAGPADFICVAAGFVGGLVVGAAGSAGGAAAGGGVYDWMMDSAAEAYRHSAEQQGDQFPPGSERAVDDLLGPPLF